MGTIKTALGVCGGLFVLCCSSGNPSSAPTAPRGVLTPEMLMETQEPDLYAAVQRLRPQWLRARGAARLSGGNLRVTVYVDDIRRGEVDVLRNIRLEGVQLVQFLTGAEATTRWGTGVSGGVILVTLAPR